jgi:hypothetical protein
VQPPGYKSPSVFDSKATLWVDQACAVEHSQAADLLRPQLIGPQHDHVFSGQSPFMITFAQYTMLARFLRR